MFEVNISDIKGILCLNMNKEMFVHVYISRQIKEFVSNTQRFRPHSENIDETR